MYFNMLSRIYFRPNKNTKQTSYKNFIKLLNTFIVFVHFFLVMSTPNLKLILLYFFLSLSLFLSFISNYPLIKGENIKAILDYEDEVNKSKIFPYVIKMYSLYN